MNFLVKNLSFLQMISSALGVILYGVWCYFLCWYPYHRWTITNTRRVLSTEAFDAYNRWKSVVIALLKQPPSTSRGSYEVIEQFMDSKLTVDMSIDDANRYQQRQWQNLIEIGCVSGECHFVDFNDKNHAHWLNGVSPGTSMSFVSYGFHCNPIWYDGTGGALVVVFLFGFPAGLLYPAMEQLNKHFGFYIANEGGIKGDS